MNKIILMTLVLSLLIFFSNTNAMANPNLKEGWPYLIENDWGSYIFSQLAVFNNETAGSVIAVATNGEVCLLQMNGSPFSGWPIRFSSSDDKYIVHGPKLGDMNGDGYPEIVFRYAMSENIECVDVYSFSGDRQEHLCVIDTLEQYWRYYSSPVFVDIDDDGNDELIRVYGDSIHAHTFDGNEFPGFPFPENDEGFLGGWGVVAGAGYGWENEDKIIVWSTTEKIHAFRIGDSIELSGWPIDVTPNTNISGPSLIETATGWVVTMYSTHTLHAWNQDGEEIDGFPISGIDRPEADTAITYYLTIADINGDSQPEILYRSYRDNMHAFNLQGEECEGFPVTVYYQGMADPPVVMYESGADSANIHVGSTLRPYYIINTAFRYDQLIQGYETRYWKDPNIPVFGSTHTALIPPENDTLYVVSFNSFSTYGVRVYEIPMEGDGTHIEWQMPMNNSGGNRLYCPRFYLSIDEKEEIKFLQSYKFESAYPNPFNPTTTVEFALVETADVKVKLYNIMGQEVTLVLDQKMNAGFHRVTVDGSNLASGVYFLEFEAGPIRDVRKIVLLK